MSIEYYPNLKLMSGGKDKVSPGEIVPLDICILPSSTIFRSGEKLRLQVSGVFRPGDNLRYTYPALVKGDTPYYWHVLNEGKHRIHTGGDHASYLLVPVIP